MSPDTVSSLFPDRPIRPLPKRRLRERLSPEVADSITYPPSTHETTPLFYYPPYTLKEEAHSAALGSTSPDEHGRRYESGRELPPLRSGLRPGEREAEETNLRSTLVTRSPPEILTRDPGHYSRADQSRHSEPPPSATSSVDGYDSFENTNNKKKRKVPTAGDSALGGAHTLNSEMRALTMSSGTDSTLVEQNGDHAHSVPGNAGNGPFMANTTGISGPGRGRIGGSRNGRSPLRALTDGSNTLAGRSSKPGTAQWAQPDHPSQGIISNAIANAEKLPPLGQENVSLLHQQPNMNKATPASTQFTFSCDSQVPGTVQWPGHPARQSAGLHGPPTAHQGTGITSDSGAHHDGSTKSVNAGSGNSSRKKGSRRLDKELAKAARERRQMTLENNRRNPPKEEDFWMCEFCEYEQLFGRPPRILFRDYELKARRQREEEADRKRLLEKAKQKGRKAKKGSKAAAKGSSTSGQGVGQTQSEEDYDEGYDDQRSHLQPQSGINLENGDIVLGAPRDMG
ncbi:hypothetical protein S7711_00600 [Stachybotrys chartarum IBT 7711]|uniref:Uncharacterized protein n=1 Tax=Stachybotrys chartarum (strain CBS 109288 / IBT 7711) TaxID=1280523 RepID=A0A084ATU9_STACB|nr:hypothetical protein S7711_00600 [Stachybotrys chartarum IBT 7711]KFA73792.1 hypothetical protein S40288_03146 [Stachybotrys chartarum IBT 40288]